MQQLNFTLSVISLLSQAKTMIFNSICVLCISFICGVIIFPLFIKFLRKRHVEQSFRDKSEVRELADLHSSKHHTPTMGGLIIVLSALLCSIKFLQFSPTVVLLITQIIIMLCIGFVDDFFKILHKNSKGISGKLKLLGQILASSITFFALQKLNFFNIQDVIFPFVSSIITLPSVIIFILYFFVFAGTSNAMNLTDGLDGLASVSVLPILGFICLLCLLSGNHASAELLNIPYIPDAYNIIILSIAFIGSCLSFLCYNSHPASIFMGDTGSLSLGAFIAGAFLTLGCYMFIPLSAGILFLEAISVILQVFSFKVFKRRVFKMAPIHHHFELAGHKETKIVISFGIVSLLLNIVALMSLVYR